MTPTLLATPLTASTRLADPVAVRLSVRAIAPLRVNLPAELSASPGWRLLRVEPAVTTPLPGGEAEWAAVAHFDPQLPGGAVPLAFHPVGLVSGEGAVPEPFTFAPVLVQVTTSLGADRALLRGAATLESPPPSPPAPWPAGGLACVALIGLTMAVLFVVRRRRPARRGPPVDWVALAAGPTPDAEFAERLAAALRVWAGRPSATTPELLAALTDAEQGESLMRLLGGCDRARFAPRGLAPGERPALALEAARLLARRPGVA